MTRVPPLEMSQVVDLVNHYAVRARCAAQDEHKGYRPLGEVLASPEAASPIDVAAWPPGSGGSGKSDGGGPSGRAQALPDADIDDLHQLADEAYEVFVRAQRGEDTSDAVNRLLRPASPTPRLTSDGDIAWEVVEQEEALRAAIAVSLMDWLHVRGADRLGLCEGIRCADAFADASPGGRKKFCSAGCLNRHKVAEHRKRAASRQAAGS